MASLLMTLLIIMIVVMSLFLLFTQKYVNPYTFIMIFGKKGSGKTTILTKQAIKHLMGNWTVYSTEEILGCYHIDYKDIGLVQLTDDNFEPFNADDYRGFMRYWKVFLNWLFPRRPKILLLIDEAGLLWHCRNFKSFDERVRKFFKMQRHYHVKCIAFSQCFDIDKSLRDLTDSMYLQTNIARVFTYGKRINKYFTIKTSTTEGNEGNSTLCENYEFDKIIYPGARTLTFIPHWSKYFDSFEIKEDLPLHKCKKVYHRCES